MHCSVYEDIEEVLIELLKTLSVTHILAYTFLGLEASACEANLLLTGDSFCYTPNVCIPEKIYLLFVKSIMNSVSK